MVKKSIIFGVLPETTGDYLHTRSIFPQSLDVKVSDMIYCLDQVCCLGNGNGHMKLLNENESSCTFTEKNEYYCLSCSLKQFILLRT